MSTILDPLNIEGYNPGGVVAAPIAPSGSVGLPYYSDGAGVVTIPNAAGLTDPPPLTLWTPDGTQVFSAVGVAVVADTPLNPMEAPGGMDSPGQIVAWAWDTQSASPPVLRASTAASARPSGRRRP